MIATKYQPGKSKKGSCLAQDLEKLLKKHNKVTVNMARYILEIMNNVWNNLSVIYLVSCSWTVPKRFYIEKGGVLHILTIKVLKQQQTEYVSES